MKRIIIYVIIMTMLVVGCKNKVDNNALSSKDEYITTSEYHDVENYVDLNYLVKFDNELYGKSFKMIDYAGGTEEIGVIDKLVDNKYVPKKNGETNNKELLNAKVYSKTDNSIVINFNNEYVLFEMIVEK